MRRGQTKKKQVLSFAVNFSGSETTDYVDCSTIVVWLHNQGYLKRTKWPPKKLAYVITPFGGLYEAQKHRFDWLTSIDWLALNMEADLTIHSYVMCMCVIFP